MRLDKNDMVDGVGVFSSKYNLKPSWLNRIDVELCEPSTVYLKKDSIYKKTTLYLSI